MSTPKRTYDNGEIVVEWRPEKCVHCEECVSNLPAVFNVQAKPWVSVEAATTDQLKETIAKCPDGALSWVPSLIGP